MLNIYKSLIYAQILNIVYSYGILFQNMVTGQSLCKLSLSNVNLQDFSMELDFCPMKKGSVTFNLQLSLIEEQEVP